MPKLVTGPTAIAMALPTNADFQSAPIPATGIDTASFTIETAGISDATGSFKVAARNGKSGWINLPLSPAIDLAYADISTFILLSELSFTEIRFEFYSGAPTDDGTYSVWFQGEGNN